MTAITFPAGLLALLLLAAPAAAQLDGGVGPDIGGDDFLSDLEDDDRGDRGSGAGGPGGGLDEEVPGADIGDEYGSGLSSGLGLDDPFDEEGPVRDEEPLDEDREPLDLRDGAISEEPFGGDDGLILDDDPGEFGDGGPQPGGLLEGPTPGGG